MRNPLQLRHRQSGMVLIVSLFILVLLVIIGVSGMKNTALEEKMAGNDRDQSLAFQAAETALRTAEVKVQALFDAGNLDTFCNTEVPKGLYYASNLKDGNCESCPTDASGLPTSSAPAKCKLPNLMTSDVWGSDDYSIKVPDASLFAGTGGRYYIVYRYYYRNKGADKTMDSYFFTIMARGTGAKGGEVILRSSFGGKIDMGKV
jgi:type IV pilus assembly protein PilX